VSVIVREMITIFQIYTWSIYLDLMTLPHPPWKGPKIWNLKPTRQDLSFDILHW